MGQWEWGNFGSQKLRSVINGAIFNRSASNLVCTHYYLVFPPGKLENSIWDRFGLFWGCWPFFGAPKVRGLISVDPDVLHICNFAGTFCIMMSKMWQCIWKLGNFRSQTGFASNLVCAHDFAVSPPEKQENFIRTRFGHFLGFDPSGHKNYEVS